MQKLNKHTKLTMVIITPLILLAMFLRIMWQYLPSNNLRGIIYIGLFTAWGVSIWNRILQVQVRRYLTAISMLEVFWMVMRSLKFQSFTNLHIDRYCWYSYYFPLLFIPLLLLLVALSLGKPEKFRLPRWTNYLFLVSAVLFILVMTNDFHRLAFHFHQGLLYFDNNEYSHGIIYFLALTWMVFCTVSALIVMIIKCHIPDIHKRIWRPFVFVFVMLLYTVLYLSAWDWVMLFAGDMTVVSCLFITAMLDSCIQSGLIQSNTHYKDLFECTGIRARITDKEYNTLLSSADTESLSRDIMRQTAIAPVMLDNGGRLCSAPIKSGYVIWSEDVSEMTEILADLTDSSEYLTTRRSVLHKDVEIRKREQRLIEQNRLYNRLANDNQEEYTFFLDLISQLEATNDNMQERKLTAKLAVVCTHIKRRGNLIFLVENGEKIYTAELRYALAEWLSNLRLCGVKCNLYCNMDSTLSFSQTIAVYDTFQQVILCTLDTLHSLLVTVSEKNEEPCLLLNLSCDDDLSQLSYPNVSISNEEEGEWVITISI